MPTSTASCTSARKLFRGFFTLVTVLLLTGLLAWPAFSSNPSTTTPPTSDASLLSRSLASREETVTVRLVGVPSYETTRLFQALLNRCEGVIEVKPYSFNLNPNRPRRCRAEWRVRLVGNDLFALESSLYHQLKEISLTGSEELSELTRELTPLEIENLRFIEPRQAGARFLTFVQAHRVAENRQLSAPDCRSGCCPADLGPDCGNHGFE